MSKDNTNRNFAESKTQQNRNFTESKTQQNDAERLVKIIEHYLASNPYIKRANFENEVEVRFGTRGIKRIMKIDYDNIVQKLYSLGFKTTTKDTSGQYYLRINSEFDDPKTGERKFSRIVRTEIVGLELIQEYCRSQNIQKLLALPSTLHNKIKITKKDFVDRETMGDVIFNDFNYSISYKREQDFSINSQIGASIVADWSKFKKTFRYINRVRFSHENYPIFVDLSIVKHSKNMTPQMTIEEAELFQMPEKYEVELEINNDAMQGINSKDLLDYLRKCIRIILSALQSTNSPISYKKQDDVLNDYMKLIHGDQYQERKNITPNYFLGPSTVTLQLNNIIEPTANDISPNIRNNYTVTDKADGLRKLLYVDHLGAIYFIDMNMNVIFTGAYAKKTETFQTIIDGEHILHDKNGKFINRFAAFDIYYDHGENVREQPFYISGGGGDVPAAEEGEVIEEGEVKSSKKSNTKEHKVIPRLTRLQQKIKMLQSITSAVGAVGAAGAEDTTQKCDVELTVKDFYYGGANIFAKCKIILDKEKNDLFQYNIDGLIFTPANLAVGGTPENNKSPNMKKAWAYSLKWKPPQYNTIDFMVSFKKDKSTNQDEIGYIFQDGQNMISSELPQYKTLILHCGYDKKTNGYINPWHMVIEGEHPKRDEDSDDNDRKYKPVVFQPTDPYDKNACFCNVELTGKDKVMLTEENEVIEEEMIVEFRYNTSAKEGWNWVPLRVRYDKTSELRSTGNNFGNVYNAANSNWYSIHHPITDEMICTGNDIPVSTDDYIYYAAAADKKREDTQTFGLRNFHNQCKKKLFESIAQQGDTLIDYAVGKGGDMQKWYDSKLSFVFGIDVHKDNIENAINGVCARYLDMWKTKRRVFNGMFVNGNSTLNIRSGEGMSTEKDKQITRAIFGMGEKDRDKLGKGVYDVYGAGSDGFQIGSCQFALHYFFENKNTLHNFMVNLSETIKVGGYFIGTCFDGDEVFRALRNHFSEEGISIFSNQGIKICEIIKMYDYSSFPDDEMSVGYGINVYQESINKVLREYLVKFAYFVQLMETYGFALHKENKIIRGGTEMFSSLYTRMKTERLFMTEPEKRISFFNRAFVFRKAFDVDAKKLSRTLLRASSENEDIEFKRELKTSPQPPPPPSRKELSKPAEKKMRIRKKISRKEKIVITDYSPIIETPEPPPPPPQPEEKPIAATEPKKKIIIKRAAPAAPAPEKGEKKPAKKPAAAAAAEEKGEKKPRCPNGLRRNPKTGECEPKN